MPLVQPNPRVAALLAVRDRDVAAVAGPDPAVEGALELVARDRPAIAQMRAEVRAVGVEGVDGARGPPVALQVLVEIAQPQHLARRQLVRPGDLVPARG